MLNRLLDLLPAVSSLKLAAAGSAGVVVGAAGVIVWVSLVTLPAARKDAADLAEAAMIAKFHDVTGDMTNDAENFRAALARCNGLGRVFDYRAGDC